MRVQIQNQEVYIAIEEEKEFREGSIEFYKNVLNECVHNGTVDPLVKDYILEEYKGLKFIFRTRKEILNFAESLQQTFSEWQKSPEREKELESLVDCRVRLYTFMWFVPAAIQFCLGIQLTIHNDIPGLGAPPNWVGRASIISGICNIVGAGLFRTLAVSNECKKAERAGLCCIKNRLSHRQKLEYLYSIFSSNHLIRDDEEFKGLLKSEAGKIENIGQIVTNYLLPASERSGFFK